MSEQEEFSKFMGRPLNVYEIHVVKRELAFNTEGLLRLKE